MMREDRWTILLTPLLALVPAGVGVNYFVDLDFVRRWGGRVNPVPVPVGRPIPQRQKQLA
jgi:hypothetical protein